MNNPYQATNDKHIDNFVKATDELCAKLAGQDFECAVNPRGAGTTHRDITVHGPGHRRIELRLVDKGYSHSKFDGTITATLGDRRVGVKTFRYGKNGWNVKGIAEHLESEARAHEAWEQRQQRQRNLREFAEQRKAELVESGHVKDSYDGTVKVLNEDVSALKVTVPTNRIEAAIDALRAAGFEV